MLAAKLRIPEPPYDAVPRPHLVQRLEEGIARHRLTVVAAPAGYGKTTLLAAWARPTGMPVAWLSLDRDENDPERLLRYLVGAWARACPEVAVGRLGILLGAQSLKSETVLAALLDEAERLPAHQAVVLDDYQWLQAPAIQESVTFLLDHLPPRLHFVLGTRSDPPLPLARYRARAHLLELGVPQLRFSLAETASFLARNLEAPLTAPELGHWHEQLEGWAAGLQLAALMPAGYVGTALSYATGQPFAGLVQRLFLGTLIVWIVLTARSLRASTSEGGRR
jgi:LuxR family maltose regulon positive regulatory protein